MVTCLATVIVEYLKVFVLNKFLKSSSQQKNWQKLITQNKLKFLIFFRLLNLEKE